MTEVTKEVEVAATEECCAKEADKCCDDKEKSPCEKKCTLE